MFQKPHLSFSFTLTARATISQVKKSWQRLLDFLFLHETFRCSNDLHHSAAFL